MKEIRGELNVLEIAELVADLGDLSVSVAGSKSNNAAGVLVVNWQEHKDESYCSFFFAFQFGSWILW